MAHLQLDALQEKLLRAGIAPRHVRRYLGELRHHFDDLLRAETANGLSGEAAFQAARTRLGSDNNLAAAMLVRPELRSLAARAPWAIFALLPAVAIFILIFAIDFATLNVVWPVHNLAEHAPRGQLNPLPSVGHQLLVESVSIVASYLVGPLFAAGCIALALRQRLSSRWVWVGLALVAVESGLFGFYSRQGGLITFMPFVRISGDVNFAATFAVVGVRAVVLFTVAAIAYRTLRARTLPAGA